MSANLLMGSAALVFGPNCSTGACTGLLSLQVFVHLFQLQSLFRLCHLSVILVQEQNNCASDLGNENETMFE